MNENIEKKLDEILFEIGQLKSLIQTKLSHVNIITNVGQETVRKLSIREFLNLIEVSGDVERTLAVGYFLEKYRNLNSFNKRDLEGAYTEAKERRPVNINDKVNLNIKNGFMMEAEEKKDNIKAWTLTSTGEKTISGMFKEFGQPKTNGVNV